MKRKFLAVFLLPVPQAEHAHIVEVIRDASGGDFKQAFAFGEIRARSTVGYVFTSDVPPWKLDFARVLLNGDDFLIVEIDGLFAHGGLGVAATWLRSHQDQEERF